jgi:hypothetical protein
MAKGKGEHARENPDVLGLGRDVFEAKERIPKHPEEEAQNEPNLKGDGARGDDGAIDAKGDEEQRGDRLEDDRLQRVIGDFADDENNRHQSAQYQ